MDEQTERDMLDDYMIIGVVLILIAILFGC